MFNKLNYLACRYLTILVLFAMQVSCSATTKVKQHESHEIKQQSNTTTTSGFEKWLDSFKLKAKKAGISNKTITTAFANIKQSKEVIKLDKNQPELSQTFWGYLNKRVTPWRIKTGQELYKKHRKLLNKVTKRYGVPGKYIVAFWGMETNYGSYTGYNNIIQSLATLSYDKRRRKFFEKELLAALKILDKGDVELKNMKGSWAGAIGQCQFMPTNYLAYAVDGDGDGKIDIWHSLPDVFFSMGHFLKELGWKEKESWGMEVSLPKNFDLAKANGKTKHSLLYWKKLGVKLANGHKFSSKSTTASLLLPSDYRGPFFLTQHNFKVIKFWNNADYYAISVGYLADRIAKLPALSKKRPKDDKPLKRSDIKKIQTKLKKMQLYHGKIDGIAKSKTRQAIRLYQKKKSLPADGQPTYRLLKIL